MAGEQESRLNLLPVIHLYYTLSFLLFVFCSDHMLQLAVGLSVGVLLLLLLLILIVCYLRRRKKEQMQYEELLSAVPSVPACSAPVILVSQGSWATLVRAFYIKYLHTGSWSINLLIKKILHINKTQRLSALSHGPHQWLQVVPSITLWLILVCPCESVWSWRYLL